MARNQVVNISITYTDIFRIGKLGEVFDLNTNNLTLDIIGQAVKAYGCVSGELSGEVAALFYRYKSVGGLEYISDFLIGPPATETVFSTHNGDSGTIWVIDDGSPQHQPLSIQWGQHCFIENDKVKKNNYVLGTCLSNVLRVLEVDIVSGWNTDSGYTWAEVGHYTIANFATKLVKNPQLKELLKNNLELITFEPEVLITDQAILRQRKTLSYTPLADVPDLVWKMPKSDAHRPLENPNHFADMDKPDSHGDKLLDLCSGKGKDMKYLSTKEWLTYYTDKDVKDSSKGILPFRAWQIFMAMAKYASDGDVASYIAAGGILAHYIGDACQPLHISYMFNGIPGKAGEKKSGDGVHEAFEKLLVNKYNKDIMNATQEMIDKGNFKDLVTIGSGKEAAAAVVQLMKDTFFKINPKDIVQAFIDAKSNSKFIDEFWNSKGKDLLPELFGMGAQCLAALWDNAWALGKGSDKIKNLNAIDANEIKDKYEKDTFIPSTNIHGIDQYLV